MNNKDLWMKLCGSVNFYIRGLWGENLLRSGEELADEYIEYTLKDEDSYSYLDKQTNSKVRLSVS